MENADLKALQTIAKCDKSEIYALVNTGAFNDIIKAYTYKAIDNTVSDADKEKILHNLKELFEFERAEDIIECYINN